MGNQLSFSAVTSELINVISAGRAGPLPFLILLGGLSLSDLLIREQLQLGFGLWYALLSIVYACGYVICMVRLQYFVVNGSALSSHHTQNFWTRRETRFISYLLVLFLLFIVLGLISVRLISELIYIGLHALPETLKTGNQAIVIKLLLLLLFMPVVYCASRLSFVFPAAATSSPCGFHDAWALGKSNGLRLTFVISALISLDIVMQLVFANSMEPINLIITWLSDYTSLIIWGLCVSLAYKQAIEAKCDIPQQDAEATTNAAGN